MKKNLLFVFAFLFASVAPGQQNVLLDRNFWKSNPTVPQVEEVIRQGNDPIELNANMFDAVTYALIERVDNRTVKHLLGMEGNEVDKLTHDGRTYIFWAAYKDNLEMMQWLVDRGARADMADAHGYSVLNFAAVTGQTNPKLYDFLLAHGADIRATNHDGANALLLVSSFAKDMEILDYFVDKGLALGSTDDHGNGIFHYASKGGHRALLQELIGRGIDPKSLNKQGENALFMAARATRNHQNGKDTFTYLEGLGLRADRVNAHSQNILHLLAGRNEDLALHTHLLEKGLDVNLQDEKGITPFMIAASTNDLGVVKFLAGSVDDINRADEKGCTALAKAVAGNSPGVVAYLLEKGANALVKDQSGNTMAYYLLLSFDADDPDRFETKLARLQKAGVRMDELQHGGNTLLHLAARDNDLALLKRLRAFDIDINARNAEGNTSLHLAAMSTDDGNSLSYLVGEGADTTLRTDFDETVYDLASENELLRENQIQLDFLKM